MAAVEPKRPLHELLVLEELFPANGQVHSSALVTACKRKYTDSQLKESQSDCYSRPCVYEPGGEFQIGGVFESEPMPQWFGTKRPHFDSDVWRADGCSHSSYKLGSFGGMGTAFLREHNAKLQRARSEAVSDAARMYKSGTVLYLVCRWSTVNVLKDSIFISDVSGHTNYPRMFILRPDPFSSYDREAKHIQSVCSETKFAAVVHPPNSVELASQVCTHVFQTSSRMAFTVKEYNLMLHEECFKEVIRVECDLEYKITIITLCSGQELIMQYDDMVIVGKFSQIIVPTDEHSIKNRSLYET